MKPLDCGGMFYLDEPEGCTYEHSHGEHLHLLSANDVELEAIQSE